MLNRSSPPSMTDSHSSKVVLGKPRGGKEVQLKDLSSTPSVRRLFWSRRQRLERVSFL